MSPQYRLFKRATAVVPPPPSGSSLFPGHVPGTIMLGMATNATGSPRPDWEEANSIIGTIDPARASAGKKPVFERRFFWPGSSVPTEATIANRLAEMDTDGVYGVLTAKIPGNDWAGVIAGNYDYLLDRVIAVANARAAASLRSFAFGIHHEPAGDGSLVVWGNMQEYIGDYLLPVADKVAFVVIPNGHPWGKFYKADYISDMFPQARMTKWRNRGGVILSPDFYDPNPPWSTSKDTVQGQITNYIQWVRDSGGGIAIGCGEFGCTSIESMNNVWDIMKENADLWCYSNYFNDARNSRTNWILVPSDYPAYSGTFGDGTSSGGSALTQGRLNKMKSMLAEPIATGALG